MRQSPHPRWSSGARGCYKGAHALHFFSVVSDVLCECNRSGQLPFKRCHEFQRSFFFIPEGRFESMQISQSCIALHSFSVCSSVSFQRNCSGQCPYAQRSSKGRGYDDGVCFSTPSVWIQLCCLNGTVQADCLSQSMHARDLLHDRCILTRHF